jgi:hypothetical protein
MHMAVFGGQQAARVCIGACGDRLGREVCLCCRWQGKMAEAGVSRAEWRKSSQWAMLTRPHAGKGVHWGGGGGGAEGLGGLCDLGVRP